MFSTVKSSVTDNWQHRITSSSLLIMTTVLLILLLACCAGSLSAQSRIYISVKAGSSAVLPCDWRNKTQSPGEKPHIEWRTPSETVFERQGGDQYEGEGYEHRVDVPEDKLLGGDCSLVLKDVRLNDSGPYESYLLERRRRRSLHSKRVFIQAVELSVEGNAEVIHSPLLIIMFILLPSIFFGG
uniref:Immunoglobulin V-set domain-containing protein n=1 Tax=Pygocentrus nattereri TaxID=42514 RepID=A0AAR2IM83_PYGNA